MPKVKPKLVAICEDDLFNLPTGGSRDVGNELWSLLGEAWCQVMVDCPLDVAVSALTMMRKAGEAAKKA